MIVVKMQTQNRQIIIKNILSKFPIVSSLPKNENREKVVFKTKQHLHLTDNILLKKHINTIQKQIKLYKSAHKLHSLHPFI